MVLSSPTVYGSSVQHGEWSQCSSDPQHKLTINPFLENRGFAVGWDYAISWLIMLPFELTAASITIKYWRDDLNAGIFIAAFLVILIAIQFFGVKGYGEGE